MQHCKQIWFSVVLLSLNSALGLYRVRLLRKHWLNKNGFLHDLYHCHLMIRRTSMRQKIRADLSKVGTPIGPYDLLIASIALANNVILVTHNTREFSRVSGLEIEDWEII